MSTSSSEHRLKLNGRIIESWPTTTLSKLVFQHSFGLSISQVSQSPFHPMSSFHYFPSYYCIRQAFWNKFCTRTRFVLTLVITIENSHLPHYQSNLKVVSTMKLFFTIYFIYLNTISLYFNSMHCAKHFHAARAHYSTQANQIKGTK